MAVKWGVVSTIKAPVDEVLEFCAHHLELGAHRLFIYLDDDNQEAFRLLSDHPKIRPVLTDDAYWQKRGFKRREKHQSRQFENAKQAYNRASGQVDWLTHIDVDEFLWPERPLGDVLAELPASCQCARIRPWEALAIEDAAQTNTVQFKGFTVAQPQRRQQTEAIYPDYGAHLNGGFLSHVAGKMIYRTGVDRLKVQIHNVWVGDEMNPGQRELADVKLLHMHAKSWEQFYAAYRFRMEKGSYRSELKPNKPREEGGLSLHELFQMLDEDGGTEALWRFYQQVCAASPELIQRLSTHGLHFAADLMLADKRQRHFAAS